MAAVSPLLFSSVRGGHIDLHNFRNRVWKPAQKAAGITPLRRVYDLRHTFATFALRAGISTFDLSRYMGTSLAMIDRTTATFEPSTPSLPCSGA
jgi:integrase